jgi:hypothetical protein
MPRGLCCTPVIRKWKGHLSSEYTELELRTISTDISLHSIHQFLSSHSCLGNDFITVFQLPLYHEDTCTNAPNSFSPGHQSILLFLTVYPTFPLSCSPGILNSAHPQMISFLLCIFSPLNSLLNSLSRDWQPRFKLSLKGILNPLSVIPKSQSILSHPSSPSFLAQCQCQALGHLEAPSCIFLWLFFLCSTYNLPRKFLWAFQMWTPCEAFLNFTFTKLLCLTIIILKNTI